MRVPRGKHGLSRERDQPRGRQGLRRAARAPASPAYVVGGAVRDLLLGIAPKDFDIATDARPEQIKPLFRRALIIGRRFRLVHVMMGPETVEVSTFRAADPPKTAEKDEHGRVLRDNVFGTQEEDARRRDFTVNALYYDPATEEVVDFHGGLADLKKRVMRVIGDPGDALPRGSGAHAARGAPGGEARPDARRRDARADPRAWRRSWSACRRRACSTRC